MTDPLVSIIIPSFAREELLQQAVQSVIDQIYTNWELFIVLDGYSITSCWNQQNIHVISLDQNSGKSVAINAALPKCQGQYIWILDDDDIALPDKLLSDVSILKSQDVDFVYSKYYVTESDISQKFGLLGYFIPPEQLTYTMLTSPGCPILHSTVVAKAKCYSITFNTQLKLAQDFYFLLHLSKAHKGGFNNQPTIHWRFHGKNSLCLPSGSRKPYHAILLKEFWKDTDPSLLVMQSFPSLTNRYIETFPEKAGFLNLEKDVVSINIQLVGQLMKTMSYAVRGEFNDLKGQLEEILFLLKTHI